MSTYRRLASKVLYRRDNNSSEMTVFPVRCIARSRAVSTRATPPTSIYNFSRDKGDCFQLAFWLAIPAPVPLCGPYRSRSTGTVQTSAKARLASRDTDQDLYPYPDPYTDTSPGSSPKFNRLFTVPVTTFSENLLQIRSEIFA